MILRKLTKNFGKIFSGTSLKDRAIHGGMWLGIGSTIENGLRFARNMILVRLLAPEAFGSMAILLAVNAAFESFTQIGIKEAIIQNPKGEEQTYLNGAWWVSFFRSIVLFAIAYVGAPWIARFYDDPELLPLLILSFSTILFNGFMSPRAFVVLKQMKYSRWVSISQGGSVCGILTAIILAFFITNVWALVIGFIVEAASRCFLSFMISPFIPGFDFDRKQLNELFKYVRGMFGLPILCFIFIQADIFVVGKLLSKGDLGLYSMVASLARIPSLLISIFINPIMMPVFSEMKDQKERINRAVMKTTSLTAYLGFPLLFLLFFNGKDLLYLVYGTQYTVVAIPFAIIFVTTLARTCGAPIATLFFATGRPEQQRLFVGIRAILIVIFIYPAVKWYGVVGAASAGLFAMMIAYFFQVVRLRYLTEIKIWEYFCIFPKALCCSLPVIIAWFTMYKIMPFHQLGILPSIIGCVFAYSISFMVILKQKNLKLKPSLR
ncbi:membrane protein [Candidatus Scalindua japonica]|uniref:Membrane protein n=1 Tax=Candidatus Scalindua japonica TaxID=1284222 RepID=A0A286TZJ5_9BACT|nr:oligosaccharide flippase family protein [Candidatus Scalindua japonica]GAX61231.1 membrane protein [Candidatus Scalindua japonica]